MKTSEVLYEAANLVEFRGWTTGSWGGSGVGGICIEGAVGLAAGVDPLFVSGSCPAYAAVQEFLGIDDFLFPWNDRLPYSSDDEATYVGGSYEAAYAKGQQRVLEVLRAAAVIEAAKEQAAVDTPAVSVAPVRSGL